MSPCQKSTECASLAPSLPAKPRWADLESPETSPFQSPTVSASRARGLPTKPRWVDLESPEASPRHHAESPEASPRHSSEVCASLAPSLPAKPRWVDLESPEVSPRHHAESPETSPRHHAATAPCSLPWRSTRDAGPLAGPSQQRQRPQLSRATREGRHRQLQGQVDEFCSLDFDAVDAAMQMALTARMLAVLKALAERVSFWECEAKIEEEAFRLLGLEEADMYAIGRPVKKATKLLDDKQYRSAYNVLRAVRPWFLAEDAAALETQRTRLRRAALERQEAKAEKSKRKDKELPPDNDDGAGEWTTVASKWAKGSDRLERIAAKRSAGATPGSRAAASQRVRR